MPPKHKLILYIIGFVLGCLISTFIFFAKNEVKAEHQAELDVLKPKEYVHGLDERAREPISMEMSIAHKDYPLGENGTFQRILILEGDRHHPVWRAEETLVVDSQFNQEKLVMRKIMAADQLVVRLNKETAATIEQLRPILKANKMKLIGPGKMEGLFRIQLDGQDPDSLRDAINILSEEKNLVAGVVPVYVKRSK